MKLKLAILVTFINIAMTIYFAYQSIKLIGEVGIPIWIGTLLPIIPFIITAMYGTKPGTRILWNWAFSLNAIVLLGCFAANVIEFAGGTSALFGVWSVTIVFALFAAINIAFLLYFPPQVEPKIIATKNAE
jgi:hypothetical protein